MRREIGLIDGKMIDWLTVWDRSAGLTSGRLFEKLGRLPNRK